MGPSPGRDELLILENDMFLNKPFSLWRINYPQYLERRQPRGDLNLDIDGAGLDALERHGGDALNHAAPACPR